MVASNCWITDSILGRRWEKPSNSFTFWRKVPQPTSLELSTMRQQEPTSLSSLGKKTSTGATNCSLCFDPFQGRKCLSAGGSGLIGKNLVLRRTLTAALFIFTSFSKWSFKYLMRFLERSRPRSNSRSFSTDSARRRISSQDSWSFTIPSWLNTWSRLSVSKSSPTGNRRSSVENKWAATPLGWISSHGLARWQPSLETLIQELPLKRTFSSFSSQIRSNPKHTMAFRLSDGTLLIFGKRNCCKKLAKVNVRPRRTLLWPAFSNDVNTSDGSRNTRWSICLKMSTTNSWTSCSVSLNTWPP